MRITLFLLLCGLFPIFAWSQTMVTSGNVLYSVADGKATVARQDKGLGGDIVIPRTIECDGEEIPVTGMVSPTSTTHWTSNTVTCEGGAFQDCKDLTSVNIQADIADIPFGAFYNCTSLTTIVFPESVQTIGAGAFANCLVLDHVGIPQGVKQINSYTFGNCQSLKSIDLPETIETIDNGAFKGAGIEQISIPTSVKNIGEQVFETRALKNIKVGYRSLKELTVSLIAFPFSSECALEVPSGTLDLYQNTEPWSDFNTYKEFDDGTNEPVEVENKFVNYDGIRYRINLKEKQAEVYKQRGLASGDIEIPEKIVWEDEEYAVTSICQPTNMISYSSGSAMATDGAFQGCDITSVVIPGTISVIPVGAFQQCAVLEKVVLHDDIKVIECAAFADCPKLTEIILPKSLQQMGSASFGYGSKSYVFGGCTALETLKLPEGLTILDTGAFLNSGIKTLEIPASVGLIGEHALQGTNLEKLTIHWMDASTLSYTDNSFGDMTGCALYVPVGSKYLYQEFYPWIDCTSIEEIEDGQEPFVPAIVVAYHEGVRYFINEEGKATVQRQNLELAGDIVIPDEIEYEGKTYPVTGLVEPKNITCWSNNTVSTEGGAFQDCAISSIALPNSIKVIPGGAFSGCADLESVTLPEELEVLSAAAFQGCSSLTELFIPESVTDLGSNTQYGYDSFLFGNCTALKKVNIPNNVSRLPEACFKNSGLNTLLITENITALESGCFELPELEYVKIMHRDFKALEYTESIFPDNLSEVMLLVPEGSKDLYSNFYPWKKFKSIEEYTETEEEHNYNSYGLTEEIEVVSDDESQENGKDDPESEPEIQMAIRAAKEDLAASKIYIPSGKNLGDLTAPEIDGYVFIGWKEMPRSMPGDDTRIIAQYKAKPTGVTSGVITAEETVNSVYTADGIQVNSDLYKLPAGIYIIKYIDGTVRKIVK